MQQFGVGLAGLGNVGAGVFKHLTQNRALLRERLGYELEVKKIALRDPKRDRGIAVPAELVTTRWEDLLDDPAMQIVVELMGQQDESLRLILGAIERGKMVVTGNKALLSPSTAARSSKRRRGTRCRSFSRRRWRAASRSSRRSARPSSAITFSRSTASSTARAITSSRAWSRAGWALPTRSPRRRPPATRRPIPTLDVNGWDAAHKAIILASLAYGFWVPEDKIHVEGIEHITAGDICFAKKLGYTHQAARHHQSRRARRDRGARASHADPGKACASQRQRRLQRARRAWRHRRRHALLRTRRRAGSRPPVPSSRTSRKPPPRCNRRGAITASCRTASTARASRSTKS